MTSEWKTSPLRDLVGFISKGIAPSYADEESETTVRVLNQKCNRNFRITYSESRLHDLARKKVPAERFVRIDDILINSTGAGTAGRIAQICNLPCDTIVDGHMIIIRANDKVSQKYLGYAMKAHQWEVLQLDEGSTGQTELNRERLLDEIMISYPTSFALQETIVKTLEGIDRKLLINEKVNDNLQQQAQAIYSSMFIDNPDPAWSHGHLSDLITVKYGKDHKKLADGIYPVYGSGGIMRYVERPLYNKESVLIPRKGTLNNVMYVNQPFWSVDTMFYTEMKLPNVAKFVYHFVKAKDLASMNAGSAVPSMTTDILNAMEVVIPSASALEEFESLVAPMYEAMEANDVQSKALSQMRDTLLPKLMSGEIDVSDIQL